MSEIRDGDSPGVRLRLGRAAIQTIAERAARRAPHQGGRGRPELRPPAARHDVDVIVRPDQSRLWTASSAGTAGAYTRRSRRLAVRPCADVHARVLGVRRRAPVLPRHPPRACVPRSIGCGANRTTVQIAGTEPRAERDRRRRSCVLNVARAGGVDSHDLRQVRGPMRPDERRREIEALVRRPRRAGRVRRGDRELERYRDERDYRLWKACPRAARARPSGGPDRAPPPTFGEQAPWSRGRPR